MNTSEVKRVYDEELHRLYSLFPVEWRVYQHAGWQLTFNRRYRKVNAVCNYTDRKIVIGTFYAAHASDYHMRMTLRHEFAHFIGGARFGREGTGHNSLFYSILKEIGGEKDHVTDPEIATIGMKWTLFCGKCNLYLGGFYRKPRNVRYHRSCYSALILRPYQERIAA